MAITLNFGVAANTGGIQVTPVPTVIRTLIQTAGGLRASHITTTSNTTVAASTGSLIVIVNPAEASGDLVLKNSAFTESLFKIQPGDYFLARASSQNNVYVTGAVGSNAVIYVLEP